MEPQPDPRRRKLALALLVTGIFFIVEVVGGLVSGSLALLSDAGHMLTDLAALGVTYAAILLSARGADSRHTFGFARLEVLAAFANSLTFLALITGVGWEALSRLRSPEVPDLWTMGWVAGAGLAANSLSAWFLRGAGESDLNLRSAWLHVIGDLASSVSVVLGALVMAGTGWAWVDPVLSLGLVVVIGWGALRLMRGAARILLESAPRGLTAEVVVETLRSQMPEITGAHHIHLWEVGMGEVHLTAHLVLSDRPLSEAATVVERASALLREKHGVAHCTFQLESPAPVIVRFP